MIPTDPTMLVTVLVSVALVIFIGVICFFALAPVVSEDWAETLGVHSQSTLEGSGTGD